MMNTTYVHDGKNMMALPVGENELFRTVGDGMQSGGRTTGTAPYPLAIRPGHSVVMNDRESSPFFRTQNYYCMHHYKSSVTSIPYQGELTWYGRVLLLPLHATESLKLLLLPLASSRLR